jgi:hypothetical protein
MTYSAAPEKRNKQKLSREASNSRLPRVDKWMLEFGASLDVSVSHFPAFLALENFSCQFCRFSKSYAYYEKVIHPYRTRRIGDGDDADRLQPGRSELPTGNFDQCTGEH